MNLFACTCLLALACCAPAAHPRAIATPPRHEVTVFYSSTALAGLGVPLPSPLVKGAIAGQSTTMIVDTGAHMPLVATWLAREASVKVGEDVVGRDAAGRFVKLRRADHAAWSIDGWGAVPDGPVAIGDLPDTFRQVGVGAIVSPQTFATADSVVVLDLVANRLRLVPRAQAPEAPAGVVLEDARLCLYDANGITARSLIATVSIDGTEVTVDLDTGTNGITVARESAIGRRLLERPNGEKGHGLGASGQFDAIRVADVPVRFGALETSSTVAVVAGASSPSCKAEGRLGMDYLKGCVLVIGTTSLKVTCEPPPISTGSATCDACMQARCKEPSATCRAHPARCNAFAACGATCTERACLEECATRSPEGMALNRCLNETCRDACASH